jgi:methionine synthase II (cobalamin-independent)
MAGNCMTGALPRLLTSAIGSMPHVDAEAAVDLILNSLKTAPHLPQLSRRDPREQMWIQFSEKLPGFKVDLENLKYFFDTSDESSASVEQFYEEYLKILEGSPSEAFKITRDYGLGIELFMEKLTKENSKRPFLKAQVTGPLSFALSLTDENGKPIFYHPVFRDVVVKGMGLKAMWLVEKLKRFSDNVILFFDEPSLSAYGSSAFLGVSFSDVVESLNDVFSLASSVGAITGVHCCGNTDWSLLMQTTVDIINFDAVDYLESLAIYPRQVSNFLERGGVLAWGAVPNDSRINQECTDLILERLRKGVLVLEKKGINRELLLNNIIITPACGCSSLTVEETQKVYVILSEIDQLRFENIFNN